MNTTFKATSMRFANDLNIRPDETLLYLYVDSACIDVVSLRIQFHQPESSGPARRVKGHSIQHGSTWNMFNSTWKSAFSIRWMSFIQQSN